eukprot:TRINITY_DN10399_c0_g1_i1.p1 TRINITY_DN10399_c0_g1~~TRINITY_DN10399_c0_g1_i1.p1  ORF type:complete len:390 (+),score=-34.59 TRINITY_DN10399_c0_g1_i1:263-1432(+)
MVWRISWSVPLAALLLATVVAAISHSDPPTNILLNGDMEEPGVRGDSSIAGPLTRRHRKRLPAGWHLVSGSIKYVRLEHWPAASGDHSVALNGHGPAVIAQRVTTRPGGFYFVEFDLAGDPGLEDEGAVRSLRVSVVDEAGGPVTARSFEFDTFTHGGADAARSSREAMGWRTHSLSFEAPGAAITLLFSSTTPGIHGPVIDNVRVHQQNATAAFLHSPNTLYSTPTMETVGPAASPEACARRCLELTDCRGFSIDKPPPTMYSDGSVRCHLKTVMKKPSIVGQHVADSFVLKHSDCSFGHKNAMQCPDILPLPGMLPMACVAHKAAKREATHPFHGTCRALKRTDFCPFAGGYFPKRFASIGSADDYKRCSCVEGAGGIARLQCGHVV